jgi:hypothetical protein
MSDIPRLGAVNRGKNQQAVLLHLHLTNSLPEAEKAHLNTCRRLLYVKYPYFTCCIGSLLSVKSHCMY